LKLRQQTGTSENVVEHKLLLVVGNRLDRRSFIGLCRVNQSDNGWNEVIGLQDSDGVEKLLGII
jgi:hypothetical protein